MKNILLLTSTIRPKPNQPQLKLADPAERLKDYSEALKFHCGLLEKGVIDKIVFVDNSGYDLSCLKESYPSADIEWVSFYGLDYDSSYHRGYGEFRLVDHAFANANTLKHMDSSDRVWKVTGRYVVVNLARVIAMTPASFDLYCNVNKGWAEMGFMAWSGKGYEYLIKNLWQQFATDKVPELILAERLHVAASSPCKIMTIFFWPPFIIGRRGTDGSNFQGRLTRFRFALEAVVKLVKFPFRRLKWGV